MFRGSCGWWIWTINLLPYFFLKNISCQFIGQIISGDDNLPKQDDIGERWRRRKHELQVLAGAGIESGDKVGDRPGTLGSNENNGMEEGGEFESEDEFYKQVKQQRASMCCQIKDVWKACHSCLGLILRVKRRLIFWICVVICLFLLKMDKVSYFLSWRYGTHSGLLVFPSPPFQFVCSAL